MKENCGSRDVVSGGGGDGRREWASCPGGAFRPYVSSTERKAAPGGARRPLVLRLTEYIVETYQTCNQDFKYSESPAVKVYLTNPSAGVQNDGHDNANSDLILYTNLVLGAPRERYVVKELLGQGTFGQVAKCWDVETNMYVAVKIIKNHPAYYQQALVEVSLLTMLNRKFDPVKNHIVRILDYFVYQRHLCITFELLGSNLYELIRDNHFKGLSLSIVQVFSKQILEALVIMKEAGVIHCDLKPENVLITTSVKPPQVKVIDFGSACLEGQTVYSYIQSRYYRSPEVLLGYPYSTAIDMWSFGCIIAELFLGLPLFPGASEYDLLKRMIEILGGQPPDELLRDAKNTSKFFKHVGSIYRQDDFEYYKAGQSAYKMLTEEEYEVKESKKPTIGKRYFNFKLLEDIIKSYPYRKTLTDDEISKESITRLALTDFLRGLVEFDPGKRWSPLQASFHPFITGEPFICPYKPHPETSAVVSNFKRSMPQGCSQYQMASFPNGSSYGSIGSYGSYDNTALGSSYGSYGDVNTIHAYYSPVAPSGLHMQAHVGGAILGSSPDTRRRHQAPHGTGLGLSPSGGGFGPMSLGVSPSQCTPPSTHMQMPTLSPGIYGGTSPARGCMQGSPLGKASGGSQYNRWKNWGSPGNFRAHSQDNPYHSDGLSCNQPDSFSRGHGVSPRSTHLASNYPNWRSQRSGINSASSDSMVDYQNLPFSSANYSTHSFHTSERLNNKPECSSSAPDPADWDPNYSDELLLEEDNSEVSNLASTLSSGLNLSRGIESRMQTNRASRHAHGRYQIPTSSSLAPSNHKIDGISRAHIPVEGSSPSGHELQVGYGRPPHVPYSSLRRFGQHPTHGSSNMHANHVQSDSNHQKMHLLHANYSQGDPHSANIFLGNGVSWGRTAVHPIATSIPSSHPRKEYGRIQ